MRVEIRAFFMQPFARQATSQSIKIVQTERPFSNFDFVEEQFGTLDTLPRVTSQARCQGCRTMVVEELRLTTDLKEENEDIAKASGQPFSSRAFRLAFFSQKFSTVTGVCAMTDEDFIGYAIVKKDDRANGVYVYESVIRKSRYGNNFIRGEQLWRCKVNGRTFRVRGYVYAQQNGLSTVCAHASLRTATSRFRPGGMSYREMNKLLGLNPAKAKDGLDTDQFKGILTAVGANCFVGDFTLRNPPAPFQKFIYGSIESGFPAIIFFGTADSPDSYHAIAVFGHTFNEDAWAPRADRSYFKIGADTKYIPSESWLSMFVGHDDNFGSNLCIPRHYLETKRHPNSRLSKPRRNSKPDVQSVAYIISTVPQNVLLSPIRAEAIGADYLFTILPQLPDRDKNRWADRLMTFADNNQLVLRTLLVTPAEYADHLTSVRGWNYEKAIKRRLIAGIRALPKQLTLWMIELSAPELFSANKRKLGEVLLRADRVVGPERDMKSFVFARLPGFFALYDKGGPKKPKYQFVPSGASGHVELYGCEEEAA
jgi:hypothetical protein